jgi:hypothetical protein
MRKTFVRLTAAATIMMGAALANSGAANAESVMSACASQWKEAKAAGTTAGQTWPQFLAQCKAQRTSAPQPSSASIAPPAPAPAPATAPAQSGSLFPWWQQPAAPAQTGAPAPTGAGQFTTEAEARYRCPTDKVVWVNTKSRIYHYQGTHNYGHTKEGAYMCEADAKAAGDRASRSISNHRHTG